MCPCLFCSGLRWLQPTETELRMLATAFFSALALLTPVTTAKQHVNEGRAACQ